MSHVYPKIFDNSDDVPNDIYSGLGYVYIVCKNKAGPVKVGIASNARKRVKELECMNGTRFQAMWISAQCENYREIEASMHERMAKVRSVGEWFAVPFHMAIEVARDYRYKGVSRRKRIDALATIASQVKAPTAPTS